MRATVPFGDCEARAWVPMGPAGLQLKELNRDPATGARTALLVSPPRAGVECKAQYHDGEEEFFCLAGTFTFDGVHWFRPGSYACFPPRVVHGARVQVPGGYRLYLRTRGSSDAVRVAEPTSDEPYRLDGRLDAPQALLLEPAEEPRPAEIRALRREPEGTVELHRIAPGESVRTADWRGAPVELLLTAGRLHASDATLAPEAYGFYPDGADVPSLRAIEACTLLVHRGAW
jgi:hypothetical protein